MKEIQFIALDLDGTLLTRQQTILSDTKEVLIEYQKQGGALALVSGRDLSSIQKIGHMLHMEDYPQNIYVCLNGLEIYDMQGSLLHEEKKITFEESIKLDHLAQKYKMDCIYFFEEDLYVIEYGHTSIIDHHFVKSTKHYVQYIEDIPKHLFMCLKKIVFIQNAQYMKDTIIALQKETEDQFEVCMVEDDWVEINPYGLNKGKALQTISKIKNISLQHMMAFGNGENDISMLQVAGIGVAMGNSFATVKEKADAVCDDCEANGIAKYLKHYQS